MITGPDSAGSTRASRAAVGVLFFVNGAAFANWVPRIPEVKAELGLSTGALGAALLGMGLGALAGSVAAGSLIARHGSRAVVVGGSLALCATLPLPALTPAAVASAGLAPAGMAAAGLALAAALAAVGVADAVMDVAMNAHGVVVERRSGRSILNGFHGLWSLGALAGAISGSLAAAARVAPEPHLAGTGLLLAAAGLLATTGLLPAAVDRAGRSAVARPARGGKGPVPPTRTLATLGLLALLGALIEGVPGDWSAVYLAEDLGAAPGAAGAAYVAFSLAMLAGRLGADAVVTRWEVATTTRAGVLLAATGLVTGLVVADPLAAALGFGAVGLGVCTLFPAVFGAAGNLADLPPGAGIATVSLIARLGFMAGPPLIGAIAEATSLPAALGVVAVAAVGVAILAGALVPARGLGS